MLGRCQSTRTAKNVSVNSFQKGLAAWLLLCVCMTQAPMWRAQAASLAVSYNSSKSGPRHERSVSSSSPLIGLDWSRAEVTCSVIGWHWSRWKIFPFPFLPFLECSGKWFCVYMCVYIQSVFVCVHARRVYVACSSKCECVFVCWLTWPSVQYYAQAEVTSSSAKHCWKTEVSFHASIHARWVTVTSLNRWCKYTKNQLILQKEWASQLSEVGSVGQKLKAVCPHRPLCVSLSSRGCCSSWKK